MSKFGLVPLVVLFISCAKEVPPPQPEPINLPPGEFEVTLENITDRNVSVSWGTATDPEQDQLTYEVAVNDSVVAFDIIENSYTIDQLTPDQNYEVP
jgi:hypothetical protein